MVYFEIQGVHGVPSVKFLVSFIIKIFSFFTHDTFQKKGFQRGYPFLQLNTFYEDVQGEAGKESKNEVCLKFLLFLYNHVHLSSIYVIILIS